MIFLAVTMGFLAESLHESINDKEKERDYINSFIQNLKDDTVSLNNAIKENEGKISRLESFIQLSFADLSKPANRLTLYSRFGNSLTFYSLFKSNDATMLQLKNSGGLRLIKKDHVADSIAKYDNEVKIVYAAETLYTEATNLGIVALQEILDQSVFFDSTYYQGGKFTGKTLPFLTDDPKKLKWFFNKADFEIGATKNYIMNMKHIQPNLVNLIRFLKKEYNMK